MLNIKFDNEIYAIPTTIYEITVGQFEDICIILNKPTTDLIDKWFKIFEVLKMPKAILNSLDKNEFIELTKEISFDLSLTKVRKEIEFNGTTYKAYDKTFNLKVKDILLIENMLTINPNRYIAELIAIIYKSKDEDETKFDLNYIQSKANIIRNEVKANYCIALINLISKSILNNLNSTINETN